MADPKQFPHAPSDKELAEAFARNASGKKERPCRKCAKPYLPGAWNFHDLCDECFEAFDTQKMLGRMPPGAPYFESSAEWIEWTRNPQ